MSFTDDNLRDDRLRDDLGRNRTWDYRDSNFTDGRDLVGYHVEATDGSIGKIDEASTEAGASHVVVDTGPWIFGTKRLIPAGAIMSVDHDDKRAYVDMTKDQIKDAPDFDRDLWDDDARTRHDDYYRDYGPVDDRLDDPRNPL